METFGLPECTPHLQAKLRNMPPELLAQIRTRMLNPMHISEVLAETFKAQPTPENLTAWADSQPIPGQGLLFCDEVNTEFVR